MRAIALLVLVLSSFFAAGCATRLTSEGEKVNLVRTLSESEASNYRPIGILTCQKEQNLASVDTNRKSCENDLRNQAAEKGAHLVLIDSDETFPGTGTVGVSMIGHAFRER